MPYVRFAEQGLITMREAAKRCEVPMWKFWDLVRSQQAIPEPTTKRGSRSYYDAYEFRQVQATVNRLRKEGRVK